MGKYTMVVLRKELKDTFRDKKTVYLGLLMPLLLYPILFWFMGRGQAQMEQVATTVILIDAQEQAIDDSETINFFVEDVFSLRNALHAEGEGGEIYVVTDIDDPMQALLDGDVGIVLQVYNDENDLLFIRPFFNNLHSASLAGIGAVSEALYMYSQAEAAEKMALAGIVPPFVLQEPEVRSLADGGGDEILSMMVPMLLLIMLAVGSMAYAVDMFAGEKERKTLEPLLTTRAGRGQILTGKFLAVSLLGLITTITTLGGLMLGLHLNADTAMGGEGFGGLLELSVPVLILSLLLIITVQLSFSALHVIFSSWAKNVKEASTYGTGIMIAAMIPAYATMFMMPGDVPMWMMFVPFVNVAGALKMLLGGFPDLLMVGIALASSLVFLLALLFITTRMFKKEEIMLRM